MIICRMIAILGQRGCVRWKNIWRTQPFYIAGLYFIYDI